MAGTKGWALTVEHLALGAQAVTLGDEVVNLFATLQDALDGFVQHNLGLVELLLDLHDAVGLPGVLILGEVVLELGHDQGGLAGGPRRARVLGEELVDDLAEDLVRDERGVLVVRDDDAADALCAAVGVKSVICLAGGDGYQPVDSGFRKSVAIARGNWVSIFTLLFDILALARPCALGDRLCEQRHELAIAICRLAGRGSLEVVRAPPLLLAAWNIWKSSSEGFGGLGGRTCFV